MDYTIIIAFAGVVFCTGDAWIMPLMRWCLPEFRDWIEALPHSIRLLVCGGMALVMVAILTIMLIRISRWK